jgi:hypothetical protein
LFESSFRKFIIIFLKTNFGSQQLSSSWSQHTEIAATERRIKHKTLCDLYLKKLKTKRRKTRESARWKKKMKKGSGLGRGGFINLINWLIFLLILSLIFSGHWIGRISITVLPIFIFWIGMQSVPSDWTDGRRIRRVTSRDRFSVNK